MSHFDLRHIVAVVRTKLVVENEKKIRFERRTISKYKVEHKRVDLLLVLVDQNQNMYEINDLFCYFAV